MAVSKTILISGGSRGIGQAIGLRFAAAGWNVAVATKDTPENIHETADRIIAAGGQPLVLDVNVAHPGEVQKAVDETVNRFGGIDVLVNNTSATCFTDTLHTSPEQFELIIGTSVRAAFFFAKACFPFLKLAGNPHIINIAPPLNLDEQWFKDHLAFSVGKCAMTLCTRGLSAEFEEAGIAVNSLWPQTTIATQTIKDHFVPKVFSGSRWPSIMADAAFEIARRTFRDWTGQFFTDEAVLRKTGVADFSSYAVDPDAALMQPLFIPLEAGMAPLARDLYLTPKTAHEK